ncbi:MAG: LAGLIDADG endonuclease [Patescibacteria group bacterium]
MVNLSVAISREVEYNEVMIKKQHEIIIGTLLGDAWIDKKSLRIKQSDGHKDYVFWLYSYLKDLCNTPPKQRSDYKQWYFQTRYLEDVSFYREIFYKDKKKIVPENIKNLLVSPLSLAIWYMDDGSLDFRPKDHYNFSFCTNAFTIENNKLLVNVLKENFGVESSIQTPLCRGKRYPEIYIGAKGRDRFFNLISPYVLKCFSNRIPPYTLTPQRLSPVKGTR